MLKVCGARILFDHHAKKCGAGSLPALHFQIKSMLKGDYGQMKKILAFFLIFSLFLTGCSSNASVDQPSEDSNFFESFTVKDSDSSAPSAPPSLSPDISVPDDSEFEEELVGPNQKQIVAFGDSVKEVKLEWQILDVNISKTLTGFDTEDVWQMPSLEFEDGELLGNESFLYITFRIKNVRTISINENFHSKRVVILSNDLSIENLYEMQAFDKKMFDGHGGSQYEFQPEEEIETTMLFVIDDEDCNLSNLYYALIDVYPPKLTTKYMALE